MRDLVLGAVGGLMVLLAAVVGLRGGPADGEVARTVPPTAALLEASVDGQLSVLFTVQEELEQQAGGWGIGGFHLHLRLDELELMPAAGELREERRGVYRWTVRLPAPGEHSVQLYWSDERHREVQGSGSEVLKLRVAEQPEAGGGAAPSLRVPASGPRTTADPPAAPGA